MQKFHSHNEYTSACRVIEEMTTKSQLYKLSPTEEFELTQLIKRKAMYDGVLVAQKVGTEKMMDIIFKVTCQYLGQDPSKVKSLDRHRAVCDCRQIGMYLMHTKTKASLIVIAKYYGRNEHTIVISSIEVAKNMITTNPDYETKIKNINKLITAELLKIDFELDLKLAA